MITTLAIYTVVLGGLVRIRRRGRGSSLMQPFDEIWHPAAHEARIEVEVQQELPAPGGKGVGGTTSEPITFGRP